MSGQVWFFIRYCSSLQEFRYSYILSPGNPWTVWTVSWSEIEGGLDNPVDLILYGDKGHSEPVVIGGAENFRFTQRQVDVFEVSC